MNWLKERKRYYTKSHKIFFISFLFHKCLHLQGNLTCWVHYITWNKKKFTVPSVITTVYYCFHIYYFFNKYVCMYLIFESDTLDCYCGNLILFNKCCAFLLWDCIILIPLTWAQNLICTYWDWRYGLLPLQYMVITTKSKWKSKAFVVLPAALAEATYSDTLFLHQSLTQSGGFGAIRAKREARQTWKRCQKWEPK